MASRKENGGDIIEKGSGFYWYLWHLGNEGGKTPLDSIFLFILHCLTPLYYVGFLFKRWISTKATSKQFPVISVGNLTLGGTGKTPCVEYISRKVLERKRKVGVLTTGFGGTGGRRKEMVFIEEDKIPSAREVGDESYLLAKHLKRVPVFASRHRFKSSVYAFEKKKCDTFVMDEGFQYFGVKKDLDILLINRDNPFGNGHLFPGGTLREPVSAIRRADLVIITHADAFSEDVLRDRNRGDLVRVLSKRRKEVPVLESIHHPLYFEKWSSGEKYGLKKLKGKKVLSLSSLGDPLYFERTLERLKLSVVYKIRFPDHYSYKLSDMEWIINMANNKEVDFIVSTEKDSVRFPRGFSSSLPILLLVIEFKIIKDEEIFDSFLDRILEKYQ